MERNDAPIRVLFFDYWTKGVANFHRIINAAPPATFEFALLHVASLNNYQEPSYCVLDGLPCYDIQALKGEDLAASISALSPDVVINLNIGSVLDRVLYLTCAKLGVPTIYIDHGAVSDSDVLRSLCQDIDRNLKISAYSKRFRKFCRLIPWYFKARKPRPAHEILQVLVSTIRSPKQSIHFPVLPSELWPTLALTYNNDSAKHLLDVLNVPADRVRVVGNPELDVPFKYLRNPMPENRRQQLFKQLGLDPFAPIVFYADEGLARSGIFGWTNEIGIRNFDLIAKACSDAGLQLLVRPRQGAEEFLNGTNLSTASVVFNRTISLVDSLALACASIGCLSTVHETALVMRRPLITPLWFLNTHPTDHLPYLKYGAAYTVTTHAELVQALRNAADGHLTASTANYEHHRFGQTDGCAAHRIVEAIMHVVNARSALTV